jgi:DNA repair ATPase RecN
LRVALAGPINEAPEGVRPILENKGGEYYRSRPVAVINASDIKGPEDLKKDGASCFIKMSSVSVEALRQAFLDPQSRIRLNSDPQPEPHAEFLAVTWEGGFLGGTSVHLNGNLNVLVGGRGTGKSTMIESMRYALGLDPLGEDARKAHEGVVRHVLRPGTKVSLLVRSHKPSRRCYTIERSVPNPPTVKDESGEVLTLSPRDVMPGVEVFGQHEISELTKSREKLTLLLQRFVEHEPSLAGRKSKLKLDLERSRSRIIDIRREMQALDERLAALPGLEETQERFQEAGLEDRLKERALLIREERVFANVGERLEPIRTLHSDLAEGLPIDSAFVSPKALEGLPNAVILSGIKGALDNLSTRLQAVASQIAKLLAEADKAIADTKGRWSERRKVIEETYEKLLRELQKSKIDGTEFIRLRQQIEELRPLRDKKEALNRDLTTHEARRRKLLSEWEDIKASEYREIQSAAKEVSRKLRDRVRVEVTMAGNRDPLEQLLREVGGNLSAALERLRSLEQIALPDFAQRCLLGDAELILGLAASGEGKEGHAKIAPEHMGSIDSKPVRELVEEILEGGKDAFEMRRSKYGF